MENIVYLADGQEITTDVQASYGRGTVEIEGRNITVEKLPAPYQYRGYGELVPVKLKSGTLVGAVLQPQEYVHHMAVINVSQSSLDFIRARNPGDVITSSKDVHIMVVYDQEIKQWREMTDEEVREVRKKAPVYGRE